MDGMDMKSLLKKGSIPAGLRKEAIRRPAGVFTGDSVRIIESLPDAIVIVDGAGAIVLANSQAEKLFGYPREAMLGGPVEMLIPTRFRDRHVAHRSEYSRDPRVRPMGSGLALYGARRDGTEFPVEISLSPLEMEGGTLVTAAVRDATERKNAEKALLDARDAAESSRTELESFTYSVSHDLRAPLRAIAGFAAVLLNERGDALGEEGKRVLSIIRDNIDGMGVLIDSLLEFTRLGSREPVKRRIDMTLLVKSVFVELRNRAPERNITLDLSPLPEAMGDLALVREVLVRLLSNAIKFTATRGEARIEVGVSEGSEYFVKDNGVGFDMRYSRKLFGIFQRLHGVDEYGGAGIGLAFVHRIISHHGGRVRAEGRVNEGATFYFTLPDEEAGEPPGGEDEKV